MATIYRASLRTTRMNAVVTDIDSGSGAGILQVGTSGMGTVLFEVTLNDPCGTVSGDVLTFSGFPKTVTPIANGTAAAARIRTSAGTDVITGITVGTTGTNITLGSTTISTAVDVTINSATLTHAST